MKQTNKFPSCPLKHAVIEDIMRHITAEMTSTSKAWLHCLLAIPP